MTSQAMPNPIELYEAATQQTRRVVQGIKSAQLINQTPCAEWNIQALLDHVLGGSALISNFATGGNTIAAPAGKNVLASYDNCISSVLKVAKAPGFLEKRGQAPPGEMQGAQFMWFFFMDNLVHGWDVAKATGQHLTMDPKLAEICLGFTTQIAEFGRKGGAFGPEVQVPANASIQDRLLGLTGRKP